MDSTDNTVIEPAQPDNPTQGPVTDVGVETDASPDYHIVKVNGEEVRVPYDELVNGYSRQADYTRKTQELAADRERLATAERLMTAFDRDPERTLRTLAEAYGIEFAQQTQAALQTAEVEEYVDPEEQRIRELQSRVDSIQQTWQEQQVESYIEQQYRQIEDRYGQFDRDELAEYMIRTETRDFDTAFKALAFEKALQRATSDRAAQEAKRGLPPLAGGHGVQSGAFQAGSSAPGSVREAFAAAKQELFG